MPAIPPSVSHDFERYIRAPALLREALAGLDASSLNRRPAGEDWSIRDVLIHLCDAELVVAVQLRLVAAEDDPLLPAFDTEAWKRRLHYLWRDPEAALALFQLTRFATAEMLQNGDTPTWARPGRHPVLGAVTLASLLASAATHGAEHLAQVQSFRERVAR